MKHCNKCGKENLDNAIFCKYCGHKIKAPVTSSKKAFCNSCGKEISKDAKFCKYCGANVIEESEDEETPEEPESFSCEYCGKEFNSEIACLKHEKSCPNRESESSYTTKKQTYVEETPTKRSSGLSWVIIIIIIVIAAIILMNMYNQGQYDTSVAGQIKGLFE